MPMIPRRTFLTGGLFAVAGGVSLMSIFHSAASAKELTVEDVLFDPANPVLGNPEGDVTIVEFFDPACEACRAFHPIVKQILTQYPDDVRVVMRYTPFHGEGSELAIKVLEAARLQDVFVPVLEALLENQPAWAAANQIMSPSIVGVLNQDRADVEAVGIQGTPTFFVNGKPLPEFGAEQLLSLVQAEVEAAATN